MLASGFGPPWNCTALSREGWWATIAVLPGAGPSEQVRDLVRVIDCGARWRPPSRPADGVILGGYGWLS